MPFRVFKLNSESADNTIMRHKIHWLQLAATSVINGEKNETYRWSAWPHARTLLISNERKLRK